MNSEDGQVYSKNYLKDDIEFVTEFPCLLGHPVVTENPWILGNRQYKLSK